MGSTFPARCCHEPNQKLWPATLPWASSANPCIRHLAGHMLVIGCVFYRVPYFGLFIGLKVPLGLPPQVVPDSSPPSLAKNASPRRFEAIRFGSELKSVVPVLLDPRFTQRQKQELAKLGLPLPCLFIRSQTLLTCCFIISLLCISSFNQVPPSHTSGPSFYKVSPAWKQPTLGIP